MGNDLDPLAVAASGLKLSARCAHVDARVWTEFVELAQRRWASFADLRNFMAMVREDLAAEAVRGTCSSARWKLGSGPAASAPAVLMAGFPKRSVDLYTSPPFVSPGSPNPVAGYACDPQLRTLAGRFAEVHAGRPGEPSCSGSVAGPAAAVLQALDAIPEGVLNRFCIAFENLRGEDEVHVRLAADLRARGLMVNSVQVVTPGSDEPEDLASRGVLTGWCR